MDTVQSHLSCNLNEETSPEQLLHPDSPDISDMFGNPQIIPRIGDEYQVEIPPMITGSEHLRHLMDPVESEGIPCPAHSFLLGLPVPVIWSHEQDIDFEDGFSGGPSKRDDGAKVDESIKSSECQKGHSSKRKKNSEFSAAQFDAGLVGEKKTNAENLKCGIASKCNLSLPGKSSHLIPGLSGDTWSNAEVDGFLLGLYIFGKNFEQIQRFIESKEMGDILSFYYGAFYRSDRYRRWSDGQKRSRRKNVLYGRKIFTGWRQQELLSRLLNYAPDELKNNLLEVSKSFVDGKTSIESYVFHLKTTFGISTLVEAVGIGKGKSDLTSLAMQPPKNSQISPEIPSGKTCSALTSGDIIKFLTGGFRLSKARCNDIFWEGVWPRLVARGWHSEQPKNQYSVSSKHYTVFLMPGVKKFSRRKLVKGNDYFDSVNDVLSRVASEPSLIELDVEGNGIISCNEEKGWVQGVLSDHDDSPNHKLFYLKPRVSVFSSNNIQFTIVDSSLVHGGKASKIRELRYSPIDMKFTSKSMRKDTQDSRQVNATRVLSKGDNCINNDQHREGITASSPACHIKFTIVDTSLLHGGKASQVIELRYLPIKFEISSVNSLGGTEDNSSDDSSCELDPKAACKLSSHASLAFDASPSSETVSVDNLSKNNEGKYDNQSSSLNQPTSSIADQILDEKPNTSEETRSKRIIRYHFSRRDKSSQPLKRRKLTAQVDSDLSHQNENFSDLSINLSSSKKHQTLAAFAKTVTTHISENISSNPINLVSPMKRRRLDICDNKEQSHLTKTSSADISEHKGNCRALISQDERSNDTPHLSHFQDNVSSISSPAKGDQESMETHYESSEKLRLQSSTHSSQPHFLLESRNGEAGMVEADSSQCLDGNSVADFLKATTDHVYAEEQQHIMSPRRQSLRSRPPTTRVLEALESGFFSTKKTQNVSDVRAQTIPSSNRSRKAHNRVKTTSKHTGAAGHFRELQGQPAS